MIREIERSHVYHEVGDIKQHSYSAANRLIIMFVSQIDKHNTNHKAQHGVPKNVRTTHRARNKVEKKKKDVTSVQSYAQTIFYC
jgi:hypothetical protein